MRSQQTAMQLNEYQFSLAYSLCLVFALAETRMLRRKIKVHTLTWFWDAMYHIHINIMSM